jgi:hypothetical protein
LGAVLAGTAVALVSQLILGLIGLGIGLGTLDPGTADNPSVQAFSTAAAIWWAVSAIVSVAFGAYVAGRTSAHPRPSTGGWHGLVTWALTTLVAFWLVGSAVGNLVGGTVRTVTGAAGGAASAVSQLAPGGGGSFDQVPGTGPARDAAIAALRAAVTGDPQRAEQAREQAAQALSQAQGVPIEQARDQVRQLEDQYRQQADQARTEATRVAEQGARAASRGAWLTALGPVLGGIAAWFAGRAGTAALDPTRRPARG